LDPKDLSALGGAGGALIAALSYWAKTRHERRRSTRTVLYYLLEMHHVVHRVKAASDSFKSEFIEEFKAALRKRGLALNEAEAAAAMKQAAPVLARFGRLQIETTVAEIGEAFSKALADLSREDPLLAFRLRGRDQVLLLRRKIETFVTELETESSESGSTDISAFDEMLTGTTLEELQFAIRATAWRCDFLTHVQAKVLLYKARRETFSGEIREVVAGLVESYVSRLTTASKASI
jgi:hypothetical protein